MCASRWAPSTGGGEDTGNIKVCIRVRPFADREAGETCCVQMPSRQQVAVSNGKDTKSFTLDRAYWSHMPKDPHFVNQEVLMQEQGTAMVRNVLDGFNCCLFAYGQTGSGKTFSVVGSDKPPDNRGLLPRIIEATFAEMSQRTGVTFQCHCSYLEIYNEHIRDLLVPFKNTSDAAPKSLEVHHHPKVGIYVSGLTSDTVTKYHDVKKCLDFGIKNRTVAATNMNAGSSRSHCIFTLRVEQKTEANGMTSQLTAKINLVDLAGSERQAKTGNSGERLKEGGMINKSLSNLAIVISKLSVMSSRKEPGTDTQDFVPFRNSKLTHLLQESLSGNSKTVLVAAISPALSNYDETVSTLRFAHTCKTITTKAVRNEESSESIIKHLKAEIAALRASGTSDLDDSLKGKLQESEALRSQYEKDYQEKLAEAKEREAARVKALEDMGLNLQEISSNLGVDPYLPQLINLSEDPALSGCLIYYLQSGKTTTIGSSPDASIKLQGLGILPYMCSIQNEDNTGVWLNLVTAEGKPVALDLKRRSSLFGVRNDKMHEEQGRILVNGRIPSSQIQLHHTDRIILGHAYCFRLTIPAVAESSRNPTVGQEDDLQHALREVVHDHADEFAACMEMMNGFEDKIGPEKVKIFMEEVGRILPVVDEANLITSEVRPKDALRFQLEVCSDILRYSTDEPELIVRLYRGDDEGDEEVCDVFEMNQFMERMSHIREVYDQFQSTGSIDFTQPGTDPWATLTYDDMHLILLKAEHARGEEVHKREIAELRNSICGSTNMASLASVGDQERQIAELQKVNEMQAMELNQLRAALGYSSKPGLQGKTWNPNEEPMTAKGLAHKLMVSLQQMKDDLQSERKHISSLGQQMGYPLNQQQNLGRSAC